MHNAWHRYWQRHQHPVDKVLHIIGVPMCFVVTPVLIVVQLLDGAWDLWWRPAAVFVVGYALQFIGHAIEGNDAGETCAVKKWLGRPYTPIAGEPPVWPKKKRN